MAHSTIALKSAADEIAERFRELIRSGELAAGDRLPPQRELATELGVGRAALREALAVLEQEDYVSISRGAHGGTFVRELDGPAARWVDRIRANAAELDEIVDFRIAVESHVAALAAARRTDENLDELREAVAALGEEMDRAQFRAADARFHSSLARAARNPRLEAAVRRARADLFVPTDRLAWPAAVEATRSGHASILEAVTAGDPAAAASAATAHIERTREDFRSLVLGAET
jgi:DNA-binding FadR family transcriptional regulator